MKSEKYFILLILVIAIFFRLWHLDSIPSGLYPDEAINGNEALESLKTKSFRIFYPENNGREGLFMWLISASFFFLGVSVWFLKIVPALVGILTVLGLYLLTKELLQMATSDKQRATSIALLASFFLAVSFWHVNFSRIGFRAILVPFILVFSLYFLIKGFRSQKKINFIASGIIFGLGFYSYSVFRLAPILLGVVFLLWYVVYQRKNLAKNYLLLVACCLSLIFIVALPIGFYFLKNPQNFLGRSSQISIFGQENIPKAFSKSAILHLAMFNFYGDPNWRHNLSGSPQLLWPVGILFLIGIFISIKEVILSIKRKNLLLVACCLLLLSWFSIMLFASMLTYEGVPHSLRSVGVIPPVYIFAALGGYHLYQWLVNKFKLKKMFLVACCLLLVALTLVQFNKYFIVWGNHPETKNAFSQDYMIIGNYLNSLPPERQTIVVVNRGGVPVPWPNGIPMSAQTIMFFENAQYGQVKSTFVLPQDLEKLKIKLPSTIIPLQYEENLFQKLETLFPQGYSERNNGILTYQIQ